LKLKKKKITKEELGALLEVVCKHDPKLAGTTVEQFVKEADTDPDGKVSIEECARWIQKKCEA